MDKIDLMKSLELSFFDFSIRHSFDKLDELVVDDFIEYGRSGKIFNKQEIIGLLLNSEAPGVKLENFKIKILSGDLLLVNYLSIIGNHKKQAERTLRTSIWKLHEGKWKIIFHQGTPLN